jgi:hypothetical protein
VGDISTWQGFQIPPPALWRKPQSAFEIFFLKTENQLELRLIWSFTFGAKDIEVFCKYYCLLKKKLAEKLDNPRLFMVEFKEFRPGKQQRNIEKPKISYMLNGY